jgi:hypothetical protein
LLFCLFLANLTDAQQIIKGTVVESDSVTAMPFVYIINKSNGNGTMSDNDGRFMLATSPDDTLICSYVGFIKLYVPVKKLTKNAKGEVKLVMTEIAINLSQVNVTAVKFPAYERQYMNDIIDKSRIKNIDYVSSPISALYMRYSKEGKQIQKLAAIFENLLIEEEVQRKLSREILVRLTGDENIDYEIFRKYCYYVSDYYIVTHDGAELYTKVMDCYKKYKGDVGGFRKWEEKTPGQPAKKDPDANWRKREEVKGEE